MAAENARPQREHPRLCGGMDIAQLVHADPGGENLPQSYDSYIRYTVGPAYTAYLRAKAAESNEDDD